MAFTSEWIAIASTFIALLALTFAIWQGMEQRKHNKLTVRPYLGFYLFTTTIDKNYCLFLHNFGLGPAIILSLQAKIPRKSQGFEKYDDMAKISEHYKLFADHIHVGLLSKNEILKEGDKHLIFRLSPACFNNTSPLGKAPELRNFEKMVEDVEIKIDYMSIYKEKFTAHYVGQDYKR